MMILFAILASLLLHLLSQSVAYQCLTPKYHFLICDKSFLLGEQLIYRQEDNTATMYYWSKDKRNGMSTRVLTTKNFKDWTDVTEEKLPEGKFLPNSNLVYIVYDKYNSTGRFRDEPGYILALHADDELNVYTVVKDDVQEICTPCGNYTFEGSVQVYIPPVYDKRRNLWVGMNFTHFLTSNDLVNWQPSFPVFYEVSQNDVRYYSDMFTISLFNDPDDVKWAVICNDLKNLFKYYYIFDFKDDRIEILVEKGRFEYGADLQEDSVLESFEYGLKEVKLIAAIAPFTLNSISSSGCWDLGISIVRNIQLHKTKAGYNLKAFPLQPEPIRGSKLFFSAKKLRSGSITVSKTAGKVFRLTARMYPTTATKYGLKIFKGSHSSVVIFHKTNDNTFCVDRSESTKDPNSIGHYDANLYKRLYCAPIPVLCEKDLEFEINADNMIIELFDLNGMFSFTHVIFSDDDANEVSAFTDGDVSVSELSMIIFQN